MFEKDAEESFNEVGFGNGLPNGINKYSYEVGFQKGAEFGYNKANEWHYVKDCLPQKRKLDVGAKSESVYVATRGYGIYIGYYNFSRKVWYLADNDYQEISEVYAWGEFPIPPKESE